MRPWEDAFVCHATASMCLSPPLCFSPDDQGPVSQTYLGPFFPTHHLLRAVTGDYPTPPASISVCLPACLSVCLPAGFWTETTTPKQQAAFLPRVSGSSVLQQTGRAQLEEEKSRGPGCDIARGHM